MVENIIGENCSNDIEYTVFCSSKDMPERMDEYKGARLKYVPLKANGVQSIPYDIISMMRSISGYDAVLVLGVSGCIFLPILKLFCRKKIIVNIDGLEYRRAKWKPWIKRFLKLSEKIAVRFADVIITVLIALGSSTQEMPVLSQIIQKCFSTMFVLQLTVFVHSDLPVDFCIEAAFPIKRIGRRRNGVDLRKNSSCIQTITILFCNIHCHNLFFCILAVNPTLDRVRAFLTCAKLYRQTHWNA